MLSIIPNGLDLSPLTPIKSTLDALFGTNFNSFKHFLEITHPDAPESIIVVITFPSICT
jgi:hypothetical protein